MRRNSLQKKEKRLNSELEIIRKLNSCKKLYVFYIAICWIKKDKQYYRLLGSSANTLLFWLLGIGKINPCDKSLPYELPYEIALGTLTKPRFLDCSVLISEAYRDKLMKHLKTAFKDDSDVYNRINLKDDVFSYDPSYLIMLPKNSDPYLYGDYIEAYGKKGFLGCFRRIDSPVSLNLVGTANMLPKGFLFSDDLDDPEFLKAYESFLETLFRKHDKVVRYSLRNEYAKLDKKKMNSYKNSFWDFCCDVTREFNLGKSMNRRFIRCQEDLWNVVSKTKISKKEKYESYRAAYLGKELPDHFVQSLKEIYKEDYETILKELRSSKTIWSVSHVISCIRSDIELFCCFR